MLHTGTEQIREYLELQVNLTKTDMSKKVYDFLNLYHERMQILELILRTECDKVYFSTSHKIVRYFMEEIKNKINFKKYSIDEIYNSITEYVKSEIKLLENYKDDVEGILLIVNAMEEINNLI